MLSCTTLAVSTAHYTIFNLPYANSADYIHLKINWI
jgi:hypothetical protein